MDHVGDANTARLSETFEAGRNVDTVAVNILTLNDHVAEVNSDSKEHFLVMGCTILARRHAVLDISGTLNGIDDTTELDKEPVAHGLHKSTSMLGHGGMNDFIELVVEAHPRAGLIDTHEAAIAHHVSRDDRR
jgi:hypothetical protein